MKHLFIKIYILFVVSNFSALLFAQGTRELKDWVGNKALNRINGKTFFQKADEFLFLKSKLPSDEYKYLTGNYFVSFPIEQVDSFLITHRCRPYDCRSENLWLAIKLNSNKFICVYHIAGTVELIHCYGRGLEIAQLPDSLKDDLILSIGVDTLHTDTDKVYLRNRWIDTMKTEQPSAMPPNSRINPTK